MLQVLQYRAGCCYCRNWLLSWLHALPGRTSVSKIGWGACRLILHLSHKTLAGSCACLFRPLCRR